MLMFMKNRGPRCKNILAVLYLFSISAVQAQPLAECEVEESGGSMSEQTYKVVARAIEDMGEDRLDEAQSRLETITDKVKGYERAMVFQTLGYAYAQQDDLDNALGAFEQALDTGALPRQAHEDLMLNTGQIYMANRDLDKAIETLLKFVEITCKPVPPEVHLALASAYAEREEFRLALQQVNIVLEKAAAPQPQWLQLKLALHYELEEFVQSAQTLLQLIVLQPENKENWRQLAGVLMQIEREDDALAVLAIAERQGFLVSEDDIKNLANMYLMLEIPYKAASLVQQGIDRGTVSPSTDNYQYLSEAWISAYEWEAAERALEQAASNADDGELWQRLAQVRIEKEDWVGAWDALQAAIKSGVADVGEAEFLLGIAAYHSGDTGAAIAALRRSVRHESYRAQAQQWLSHLSSQSPSTNLN